MILGLSKAEFKFHTLNRAIFQFLTPRAGPTSITSMPNFPLLPFMLIPETAGTLHSPETHSSLQGSVQSYFFPLFRPFQFFCKLGSIFLALDHFKYVLSNMTATSHMCKLYRDFRRFSMKKEQNA